MKGETYEVLEKTLQEINKAQAMQLDCLKLLNACIEKIKELESLD